MPVLRKGGDGPVEYYPFPCPADVHDHEPLPGRSDYVLSTEYDCLGDRKRVLLEQFSVVLAAVHEVPGAGVP